MALKIGDIVEIYIEMEIVASKEELSSKKVIDTSEYKREYSVCCTVNDTDVVSEYILEEEPGFVPLEDDITSFIKSELKNDFPEVDGYEILDIDDDYLKQRAFVKITSVKN